MAILGGGGFSANDPIYVDTIESFKEVFEDQTKKYTHIAFPEVYNGPKVIDLRSRGWNPINIGYRTILESHRYVYFNGWTILGLNVMDSWFFCASTGAYGKTTYIYDLIVKNAYMLAVTASTCCFCNSGGGYTYFVRCKFSGIIDANNNHASLMWPQYSAYGSGSTDRRVSASQCSFNIELHTQSTGGNSSSCQVKVIGNCNNTNGNYGDMINCMFNTISPFYRAGNNDNFVIYEGTFRFCKWTGAIDLYTRFHRFIKGNTNSAYNVVDTDIYCRWSDSSNTTVYVNFGSGINLINTDRVLSIVSTISYSLSHCSKVTQAQMMDRDYLNSIEFICGETPPSP